MSKELLSIVYKPLIQYAAEEAIAAGITTLISVTGRNKRAIEDHFDTINIQAQQGSVENVRLNGQRFDCGSVDRFMQASLCEYEKRLLI